jgi:Zn-dependent protease with chaperone function
MALRLLIELGVASAENAFGLSLLVTYWGHALVWALAAAIVSRWSSLRPSAQHALCKLALLAPIVTALLASVLPAAAEHAFGWRSARVMVEWLRDAEAVDPDATLNTNADEARDAPRGRWPALFLLGASSISGLGLLRFGGCLFLLSSRLRGRTNVCAPRLRARFVQMCGRLELGSVALTESGNVHCPMAIGTREVCLPRGLASVLPEAELDAVLAHELAHLKRADTFWFPAVALLCSLLWVQPSNRLLMSRFRRTAELACDDIAVDLTFDPAALARALLHVAEGSGHWAERALIPTVVGSPRALVSRVRRLSSARPCQGGHQLRAPARLGLALVSLATIGLNVGLAAARSPVEKALHAGKPRSEVAPDPLVESARMSELIQREREIVSELEVAMTAPGAEREGSAARVHVLELQQGLTHVRATELWLEHRFIRAGAAGDTHRR